LDSLRRHGFRFATGGGVKRLFGRLETPFSRTLLTAGEQTPGVKDAELWPGEHLFSGQSS
jgi:hypothetical protein